MILHGYIITGAGHVILFPTTDLTCSEVIEKSPKTAATNRRKIVEKVIQLPHRS